MDELNTEVAGLMNDLWRAFGVNDVICKVISVLYFEPSEISMEDIAKETGYSLSSISNVTKVLENAGMVQRIRKPKTHKVFFYMEKDIVKLNMQKIKFAHDQIKPIRESLPDIIERYKKKAHDDKSKKRLHILKNYHKQIIQFHGILHHMLKDLEAMSLKNVQNIK